MSEPTLPRHLGRYELLAEVGRGGMGVVYRARARLGADATRIVAVKVLSPSYAAASARAEFSREVRLAARVAHPNVVSLFDSGESAEGPYLVMDFVEGTSLFALLRTTNRAERQIPVPIALALTGDLLRALAAVHEAKDDDGAPLDLVHRDVSSQNLLVGNDGIGRLADFGLARAYAETALTGIPTVKGKMTYLAPEQLSGAASPRSDLYAAAVVLWELLAGRQFRKVMDPDRLRETFATAPTPPSEARGEAMPALDAFVLRGLSVDPAERHASAAEMLDALAGIEKPATPTEVSRWMRSLDGEPAAEDTEVMPPPERRRSRFAIGVVALVALTALAIGIAWRARRSAPEVDATTGTPSHVPETTIEPPVREPGFENEGPAARSAPSIRRPIPRADSTRPDCRVPYRIDAQGKRTYRRECFP